MHLYKCCLIISLFRSVQGCTHIKLSAGGQAVGEENPSLEEGKREEGVEWKKKGQVEKWEGGAGNQAS